ncbi:ABC transporter substrate-binding protein [Paenibacillus sp. 1011MAR3C5]|uniref:ABC transporter substrate-binding protein n=1 Tax=Paenibacillus sp. 1011MAR3C5 TaxID=1675787 RepID=UPI000E6CD442|nr:ABC transporter substrate-binding protein [Paenibacillus sp. 1011MAR3C5]RJE84762.1 ABC transporter substrate-binding protein [Paenibacillus sp. 1011MAR3C5]
MVRQVWKTFLKSAVVVTVCIGLLAGCGDAGNRINNGEAVSGQPSGGANADSKAEQAVPATRIVKNEFGELEIPVNPKRVAALYREDYLVALGVTPIVQYFNPMWGKQDYLGLEVPLFDVTGSVEALLVSEPDLIITAGIDDAQYEMYSKVAPTFRIPEDVLSDSRQTLNMIADLLGVPEKAAEVLQKYDQRVEELKGKMAASARDEKVVVLRMNSADKSVNIFSYNNMFIGKLLYQDLGIQAPQYAKNLTEGNSVLSMEAIPELDADHMILLLSNGTWEDEGIAQAYDEMMNSPIWKSVPAVQKGNVYQVERSHWQTTAIIGDQKKMDDLERLFIK